MRPLLVNQAVLAGHRQGVYALAKGTTSGVFYTSGSDGQVAEWTTERPGEALGIAKLTGACWAMVTLPALGMLVLAQNQEGLHFIQTDTRLALGSLALGEASIYGMVVLPGNLVAVADSQGWLKVIDPVSRKILGQSQVSPMALRSLLLWDDEHLLAAGSDGQIHSIYIPSLVDKQAWQANKPTVMALCRLPNGKLASAGRDARIKIWDMQEAIPSLLHDVPAHHYAIYDVALHPTLSILLSASMDKTLKLWDVETMSLLRVQDKARHQGHTSSVNRCLWLDAEYAVSCSDDRTAILWKLTFDS